MPEDRREIHLLLKVLDDLKDFLPHLVLVGGWVPYLYATYLWKGIHIKPLSTVDIDFGFQDTSYKGSETVAERVREKNYREHHVSMDRMNPFVPVVYLEKEKLRADVEFITSLKTSMSIKQKLIGREIKINEIENFEILFESPVSLVVEGREIMVPKPSIFVFHKLLTFTQRERPDKRHKDLYYAYYTLLFSPEKQKLKDEISTFIDRLEQGSAVRENISKAFEDPYSEGPTSICDGTGGSVIRTVVSNLRQDAYERILGLIR